MRTFRKLLVGIGLAGVLSLSVIWGTRAPAAPRAERIGYVLLELTPPANIQKPGH